MGVYLPNMEMPDCGYVCLKVFANGEVQMTKVHRGALVITGIKDKVGTAVPVPPHGRLGDLDAAVELAMQYCPDDDGSCSKAGSDLRELLDEIESLPTVIPAEEE